MDCDFNRLPDMNRPWALMAGTGKRGPHGNEAALSLVESTGKKGVFQHIALGQWEKTAPLMGSPNSGDGCFCELINAQTYSTMDDFMHLLNLLPNVRPLYFKQVL